MNKNIDLTELLKDCPKGTKFYSPVYGKIEFIRIETFENNPDPITIKWFKDENTSFLEYLRADGTFRGLGECIIFPSEKQRNWSKWQRPFVDGDFVVQGEYSQIFILKEINDVNKSDYRGKCYIGYDYENCEIYPKGDWWFDKHATEEEKQRLIDTLKENGYEWDAEKKELKTLQPFKDGHACVGVLPVKDQDDWILIPNKFNPKTLEHFNKVLVRQYDVSTWCTDFYSYYDEVGDYAVCTGDVHYDYCIPYNEDTKHLVGKTEDAPAIYRYWEDK